LIYFFLFIIPAIVVNLSVFYVFNLPYEVDMRLRDALTFIVGTLAWLRELSFCFFSISTINVVQPLPHRFDII